jgi:hypothetical protein
MGRHDRAPEPDDLKITCAEVAKLKIALTRSSFALQIRPTFFSAIVTGANREVRSIPTNE